MEAFVTTLGGGDRRWTGRIGQIDPMPVRTGVVAYRAQIGIDNSDGALLPGMTAQVYVVTASAENVLIAPVAALRFDASDENSQAATVELALPDGTTEVREVAVGIMDRLNAEIVSGLAEGDRVIAGHTQS